MGFIIMFDA